MPLQPGDLVSILAEVKEVPQNSETVIVWLIGPAGVRIPFPLWSHGPIQKTN